jgi:hypothetical protein
MQHVGRAGALVGFAFQACGAGAIVVLPAPYQQWVGLTLIGVGSVTLLVTIIWWLRHNRIHLADRIVQVEPVYIIIIGLAIAASGAVWQYYQVSMAKSGAPYISQNPGRLSNAETKSPKAAPPEHAPIQQPAASPKYDLPPDEKIRLRKSVADLAAIFDSDGLQTINLTQKLLDFVGDFQNPEDKNNIMPTVLLQN